MTKKGNLQQGAFHLEKEGSHPLAKDAGL